MSPTCYADAWIGGCRPGRRKVQPQAGPPVGSAAGGTSGKCCRKCREFMPLSSFHKNRTTADGLQYYCKVCHTQVSH